MVKLERNIVCWSWLLPLVILSAAASCCSPGKPKDFDLKPYRIVFHHAKAAFEVHFDAETDQEALERFLSASEAADDRSDLESAWDSVPELKERAPGFLAEKVFGKAMQDGDWPEGGLPPDEKETFVKGTRDGLQAFLREEV